MSNARPVVDSFSGLNRPSSAQLETLQTRQLHTRPLSDQIPVSYKSPEAQVIDKWFEDLGYYEKTLEEMTNTKLDDGFREELTAIENWFRVLSDPERTVCLYSLLKGTTPLQIRFFITVLQQMAAKDALVDPLSASILLPHGRPPPGNTSGEEIGRMYSRPNSNRLSNEYNVRTKSLLRTTTTQDELEEREKRLSSKNPPGLSLKNESVLGSDWSTHLNQRTSSLNMNDHMHLNGEERVGDAGMVKNASDSKKIPILSGSNDPQKQQIPKPRSEADDEENKDKPKPADPIDLNLIKDIPTWFRSLRLHKYTTIFEKEDWKNLIRMSEQELMVRGVAALGARRKMLKVFEAARNELEALVPYLFT